MEFTVLDFLFLCYFKIVTATNVAIRAGFFGFLMWINTLDYMFG